MKYPHGKNFQIAVDSTDCFNRHIILKFNRRKTLHNEFFGYLIEYFIFKYSLRLIVHIENLKSSTKTIFQIIYLENYPTLKI